MRRQRIKLQDRAVRQVFDLIEAEHVGHERAASDANEDPLGFQHLVADGHRVGRDEPSVSRIDLHLSKVRSDLSTAFSDCPATASLRALTRFMSTVTRPSILTPYLRSVYLRQWKTPGCARQVTPRRRVPFSQWLPLIAMRLVLACAFSVFGSVTVRMLFLNEAATLSSSISSPRGICRSKRP